MAFLPGTIINQYKIVSKIGQGGMGVVYKAEDAKLNRIVALKFLPFGLIEENEAKSRFKTVTFLFDSSI